MKLNKTTIVIWSRPELFDPADVELSALALEAENGLAYCSKYATELVTAPSQDPDWDKTQFFQVTDRIADITGVTKKPVHLQSLKTFKIDKTDKVFALIKDDGETHIVICDAELKYQYGFVDITGDGHIKLFPVPPSKLIYDEDAGYCVEYTEDPSPAHIKAHEGDDNAK